MQTEKRNLKIAEPEPQIENLKSQIENRHALSGWPMIIAWLGMLIFALHACTHMVAAGDTWVAMACGRHFVNHGVDTVEPFSANSHKPGPTPEEIKTWPGWAQWITDKVGLETVKKWHPTGWVNQNWLTHVIFYKLVPKSSYADGLHFTSNALVYWKFVIYIITVVCVYYTGVKLGVNPALSAVFSCFAMFIARSFLDVRPQGFSNLLVAVFLLILALTTYKNMLYIWLIVPLTVFWCNVHGGYIYVFIMLAAFFMLHLQALPKRWTVSVYSIIQWFVLYGLTYRFLSNESLEAAVPSWIFYLPLFLLVGASIIITASKSVRNGTIYTCHLLGWLIIFLILLPKFFPTITHEFGPQDTNEIQGYIARYQFYFVSGFLSLLGVGAILTFLRKKLVSIKPVALLHILAAGIVTFLAVIVFNPFHLTNLTHTFVISVSKDAERWRDVHEWHPAFAWDNPVGTAVPFLVMYIIAWVVLAVWVVVLILTSRSVTQSPKRKATDTEEYRWPKIDLPVLLIAALTIYMAIRSRRFIPIAAITACPVIAMVIDHIVRVISAAINFRRHNRLSISPMPAGLRLILALGGVAAVLFFGVWWGLKFKRVYLNPWPPDPDLTSVFMRMTASDAKPFCACKFIKDNKLKGKMFNYWTEGGFIAWGQEPDLNTGQTPLKLFMDGRAQAAYNVPTFNLWTGIMTGGPTVQIASERARVMGQEIKLSAGDYKSISEWIDQQLKKYNVWVVLMPAAQFDTPFVKGLEYNPVWRVVLINNKDKLFVDVTTPSGRELYEGMFTGKTLFPDEFCKSVTIAHDLFMFRPGAAAKNQGLDFAIKAFNLNPSPAPMIEIVLVAARFAEVKPRIDDFCRKVVDDFVKNKNLYTKRDGYRLRVEAVRLACMHLERVAQVEKNTERQEFYAAERRKCEEERERLSDEQRW